MRLTSVLGIVQTAATLAKSGTKAKGEYVLVQCHSVATGYQVRVDPLTPYTLYLLSLGEYQNSNTSLTEAKTEA